MSLFKPDYKPFKKNAAKISTTLIPKPLKNVFQGTLMKKCPYSKIKMIILRKDD